MAHDGKSAQSRAVPGRADAGRAYWLSRGQAAPESHPSVCSVCHSSESSVAMPGFGALRNFEKQAVRSVNV